MLRVERFELGYRLRRRAALVVGRLLPGHGFAQLDHRLAPAVLCQAALQRPQRVRNFPVLLGRGRLQAELLSAGTELVENVARPSHVVIRFRQAVDGLLPLVAEPPHAGGLLDQLAAERRRRLDNEVDIVLRRHGIAVLAQTGAGQQRIDVLQSRARPVDQVLTLTRAIKAAGDLDFIELNVEALVGVVDRQHHLGHADGGFSGAAGVDDVLHSLAAEPTRIPLAERQADGVDEIRLAAAVGADDRRDATAEGQLRAARKGLEPLQLQRLQVQGYAVIGVAGLSRPSETYAWTTARVTTCIRARHRCRRQRLARPGRR